MRLSVAVAAVSLSIIGLAVADDVRASIRKPVNIPAQGLGPALQTLARDRNFQVVYVSEEVNSLRTHGAVGEFTSEEALKQLLNGTGLTFRYLDEKTVTIVPATAAPLSDTSSPVSPSIPDSRLARADGGQEAEARQKSFWNRFRLAAADQGAPTGSPTVEKKNERASENKPVVLEEVLVTAQKREERAFDVPISIVALSADELEKREIISIDDLALAVPGLSVQSTGSYARTITLRGVSNSSGNSSLIGLYLDEASVTSFPNYFQPDLRTYDLERVEVLRGPQGTLYGEGSVGGTIRFITRNPQLDTFAMNADVAALFTPDGAPGQRIEGVVNVPVIEKQLGLRIAGTFDHEGGWIDQPAANQKNYNEQNLTDVRFKGLWQPASEFSVNAMAVIHRNNAAANYREDANGGYTQTFNLATTPNAEDDYKLYNLTLIYNFTGIQVLSTTSYIEGDKKIRNYGVELPLAPPPTPPFQLYEPLYHPSGNNFTEELRLTSIGSGPWQWTIGGFYRDVHSDVETPVAYFGSPGPLPNPFFNLRSSALSNSSAVFGDTSYKLTDRLTFGTGLRYFRDDQEDRISHASGTFHSLNPRVYAQYKLTDQVNTYASAAKGFRSGGFNGLNLPSYDPESVWTYELGTKTFLPGGRLSADVAVFYSEYRNYQITGIELDHPEIGNVISNGGDATIKGAEWALTWRPGDQWSLSFKGDYLDSYFSKINVSQSAYNIGDRLDFVPKYQYTVSAQRDFKWIGRSGFARLDYNEQGRETTRNRSIGPQWFSESDIIHMLNFDTSLYWSNNLRLGIFAQNLLNTRDFVGPAIAGNAARSRPRTFGIDFGMTF